MYDIWNRMIDELEGSELEADVLGRRQVLARLRPDAWAISWSSRQILLLELTRAHEWHQEQSRATDESKIGRYARLREISTWARLLNRVWVSTWATQVCFLQDLTWQVLEELDKLYGVRSAALQQTRHVRGN